MTKLALLALLLLTRPAGAATPAAARAGTTAAENTAAPVAAIHRVGPGEVRERIAALRAELSPHDDLYHRKATPAISDRDYDRLKLQLRELEAAFPHVAAGVAGAVAEIGDDRSGLLPTRPH